MAYQVADKPIPSMPCSLPGMENDIFFVLVHTTLQQRSGQFMTRVEKITINHRSVQPCFVVRAGVYIHRATLCGSQRRDNNDVATTLSRPEGLAKIIRGSTRVLVGIPCAKFGTGCRLSHRYPGANKSMGCTRVGPVLVQGMGWSFRAGDHFDGEACHTATFTFFIVSSDGA